MFNLSSKLQWFGDKIVADINSKIDRGAINCGERIVALARQYAPKDTHELEQSIGYTYDASSKTLRINVGAPYGPYQEFGTHVMPPHPFIRPALQIAGPSFLAAFGVDVSMSTQLPIGYIPRVIRPNIRPRIAAANKRHNRGKVAKTPFAFHHTGTPAKPVGAWAAHRQKNSMFTNKRDWNRETVSARLKRRNFGTH
jgi:HK97 gp10 family phage protein